MTIVACITALYGISVCLKAIKKLSWRSDTMSNTSWIYLEKRKLIIQIKKGKDYYEFI